MGTSQPGAGGISERDKNSLLANGIRGATGVFIDPHAPPEERFKTMAGDINWYDPDSAKGSRAGNYTAPDTATATGRSILGPPRRDLGPHTGMGLGRRQRLDTA